MNLKCILTCILLFGMTAPLFAKDETSPVYSIQNTYHAGLRMGVWANGGETPPELDTLGPTSIVKTSINDANFYFEGYFAYRLMTATYLEFSFGIVNRGSVTLSEDGSNDIGNLLVYPFLLQLKLYPLASFNLRLQPYIAAGGGLYYGKRNIQFSNNYYHLYGYGEDSETDFNYTVSGGADWLMGEHFSIDANIKYMPITFSDPLVTITDYKAVSITIGLKYRYK